MNDNAAKSGSTKIDFETSSVDIIKQNVYIR